MCRGLIHHKYPDNEYLVGLIFRKETGHFFDKQERVTEDFLKKLRERNIIAIRFEGYKSELISRIKMLNNDLGLPGYNPVKVLNQMKSAYA